ASPFARARLGHYKCGRRRAGRPVLEGLEQRVLFSANLDLTGGQLLFMAAPGADTVIVTRGPAPLTLQIHDEAQRLSLSPAAQAAGCSVLDPDTALCPAGNLLGLALAATPGTKLVIDDSADSLAQRVTFDGSTLSGLLPLPVQLEADGPRALTIEAGPGEIRSRSAAPGRTTLRRSTPVPV